MTRDSRPSKATIRAQTSGDKPHQCDGGAHRSSDPGAGLPMLRASEAAADLIA